jgi:Mce-associated membrane protein
VRPRNPVLAAATLLAVAAAACAGWFGWSWYQAAHSATLADARTRDAVLQSAEQAVLNFNTLDYRHASAGLRLWLDSSTGTLHSQLSQDLKQEVQLVQGKKTITTAKILDGAVTQLDTGAGTASVMVAVAVTVTPAKGSPFTERESEVGQLSSTPSGWKLSALGYPSAASG